MVIPGVHEISLVMPQFYAASTGAAVSSLGLVLDWPIVG